MEKTTEKTSMGGMEGKRSRDRSIHRLRLTDNSNNLIICLVLINLLYIVELHIQCTQYFCTCPFPTAYRRNSRHSTIVINYRLEEKFGKDLNLAIWRVV